MMELLAQGAKCLGFHLTTVQLQQFEVYYHDLAVAKVDLTSVIGYEDVQRRHFLESLAILALLYRQGALAEERGERLLDLGTGAGFPGLPMAIVDRSLRLTLLEATGKKTEFLRGLVNDLDLSSVMVIAARAELAAHDPQQREAYDVVTARAVAPLPTLVELGLPFLRLGGYLAAPKGSRAKEEVGAASKALAVCGGELVAVEPLVVPGASASPTLVLVRKVAPTPHLYPRRPGMPTKRPIR